MIRRPPRSTRTDTLFPCTTLFRSVPGFLVQPLVENAIKHGVAPSRDPVNIAVRAVVEEGDLCITVANDHAGAGAGGHDGRTGVGLINIERRLEAVSGKTANLRSERGEDCYPATQLGNATV